MLRGHTDSHQTEADGQDRQTQGFRRWRSKGSPVQLPWLAEVLLLVKNVSNVSSFGRASPCALALNTSGISQGETGGAAIDHYAVRAVSCGAGVSK